jgi:hypothetical protein
MQLPVAPTPGALVTCGNQHRSESAQRVLVQLKVRETLQRSSVKRINSVRFLARSVGHMLARSIKAWCRASFCLHDLAPVVVGWNFMQQSMCIHCE